MLTDINRGTRALTPSKTEYINPETGKKVTGTRLQALNAWNEIHENKDKYGKAYDDSLNTSLSIRKEQARQEAAKAKSDRAFNEALRQKQKQDAARESARVQKERERQARLNDIDTAANMARMVNDAINTSNRRKRNNGKRGH